ncbi:GtrA family protein [Clostridium folliculivorans]|uniref:Membrane protein n=1 Tax=Clostridium folliculivorans TaxID=2886038 RepID=A0A9W5Y340_9CLOT|nr:GtrA family protein [Clostridium folliculivorans]GKU25655.1 membrane protein [Clostridium folliculivorans]GKU28677.1 membrane protein [Clostridium folliculivorans]
MEENSKLKAIIQFITYSLVGSSNVIIDLIVLNILWTVTGLTVGRINFLFKLISFCIYSTSGYLLNKKFTFKSESKSSSYFGYVSLLGILSFLDAVIIANLTRHNIFHIHRFFWANISAFLAAMLTGILGFIINKFVIFNKED